MRTGGNAGPRSLRWNEKVINFMAGMGRRRILAI
jgi:hypothetical protein